MRRQSIFQRIRRAIRREFRRIRDEHRSTGHRRRKPPLSYRISRWWKKILEKNLRRPARRRKPPLSYRIRHWWKKIREKRIRLPRPPKRQLPPLTHRIKYFLRIQRERYAVVFSSKYLVIALNSTALYLISFFLVHFLTHLVTGLAAYSCEISTTLTYTVVDFHIRYWDWTPEMVIIVFSIPAMFALIIALLASLAFINNIRPGRFFKRFRYLTKKQRHRHHQMQRKKEIGLQVQRLQSMDQSPVKRKVKKKISWKTRLFLLWTMYHTLTYFFSGMLYAFLFHRRFGYVIWYAFDSFYFDLLFSVAAFLLLLIIGYAFAAQFLFSGRMYFNELNDRNRMPFVVSQAVIPFIAGTILTILFQVPKFDPALILLNFSIFFLLLPLPSRASVSENIHFDSYPKPVKIFWKWIVWTAIVVIAVLVAVKIGVPIRLP